jgi:DNA mismatch repair protein MutS
MYKEYNEAYAHYSGIYGPHTAIFYLVGKFYELYDWQHKDTGLPGTSMLKVVDILGVQMSIRKEDGPEGTDGFFAGVPEQSLHKYAALLTRQGWTVVIYDQNKDAKGAVSSRTVSRILTPGTHVEAATSDSTYVAAIWLEEAVWGSIAAPSFALSAIDLTTGRIHTYEGAARGKQSSWAADDAIHFFQVYAPRECTLWWRGSSISMPTTDTFRLQFGLHCGIHVEQATKDRQGGFETPLVREDFLKRSIRCPSLLSTRHALQLNGYVMTERCLCALLQRLEDMYPSGIQKFFPPSRWSPSNSLFLGNQALVQLNMITAREEDSVLALFGKTQTPFGKRAMRNRLLYPHADPVVLNQHYREIQVFDALEKRDMVERLLSQTGDLPRLHRRIVGGDVSAAHVLQLDQTYTCAQQIAWILEGTELSYKGSPIKRIHENFGSVFSVEKARSASDTSFCFQPGISSVVDTVETQIAGLYAILQGIAAKVSSWSGLAAPLKIDYKEREAPTLLLTKAAATAVSKALKEGSPFVGLTLVQKKASAYLEIPELGTTWSQILLKKFQLSAAVKVALIPLCDTLSTENLLAWDSLESWLSLVDVSYTIWKTSKALGYVCPTLVEGTSQLSIKDLRHPLIELQATRTEYVKHSVELNEKAVGWLVYGMNASGKSSLMKAVGIAVLLAQAGCYVPASSFCFAPFKSLFTRILNTDNLWAGLSSFAVEMTELREILQRADESSLVLGDELCSGTESISATALVGAGLHHLHSKDVKFIFATHLHGLLSVVDLPKLLVWHLKVRYDPATDILVYERRLTPGPGSSLYGLEVARAMNLPEEILGAAIKIRNKLLDTASVQDAPKSAWNSSVQRRECEVCKDPILSHLEVHHIQPREAVVDGKNRDGTNQNDLKNLIVVCSKCHDAVHASTLHIGSVVQTSEGPIRTISVSESQPTKDEDRQAIHDYLLKYPKCSPKRAIFDMEQQGIKVSHAMLRSIRNKL